MKRREHGFGAIELVVLVAVLVVIGVVGWRVYMTDHKTEPVPSTTNTTANQLPDGFTPYKNTDLGLQFAYPKAWGEVVYSKKARNKEEFEPVKTNFFGFSANKLVTIKISPSNWSFSGGQGDWDFPVKYGELKGAPTGSSAISVKNNQSELAYVNYSGFNGSLAMAGYKTLDLAKLNADTVEVAQSTDRQPLATDPPFSCVAKSTAGGVTTYVAGKDCFSQTEAQNFGDLIDSIAVN